MFENHRNLRTENSENMSQFFTWFNQTGFQGHDKFVVLKQLTTRVQHFTQPTTGVTGSLKTWKNYQKTLPFLAFDINGELDP